MPLLEGFSNTYSRETLFRPIVRMGVPCGQTIGSIVVEAIACNEEEESIGGRQALNDVGWIVSKLRPHGIGIKLKVDILEGNSHVLDGDFLHRSRMRQGILD